MIETLLAMLTQVVTAVVTALATPAVLRFCQSIRERRARRDKR